MSREQGEKNAIKTLCFQRVSKIVVNLLSKKSLINQRVSDGGPEAPNFAGVNQKNFPCKIKGLEGYKPSSYTFKAT